jgi:hypothetical protein
MKTWKKIWCKTIGNRISECPRESDYACLFRTIYTSIMFITCFFIIAGVIHRW